MGQCKKPGDPGTKRQYIHPGERFGKLTVIADSGERQRKLEAADAQADDGQSANPTDAEKVQKELSKG